jgi:large subunit ribosomal protein L24
MRSIRKGDVVEVISGNDRGKRGRVIRVLPDKGRVLVEGVNVRWKHMRKSQKTPQGGRIRRETPVPLCKVMYFDEAAGRRTRVGARVEGGRKVRVSRRTGKPLGAAAPARTAKPPKAPKAPEGGEE